MSSPVDPASLLQGGSLPQQAPSQQPAPNIAPAPNPQPAPIQALGQMGPQQAPPQTAPQQNGNPNVVKSLLTNFFYGFGQSALHAAGMPTAYEQQQQAKSNAVRQQQLQNATQETQAMVALHQQQLAQQKDEYTPVQLPAELAQITGNQTVYKKDLPAILERVQSGQNALNAAGQNLPLDDATAQALGLPPGTSVPKGLVPMLGRMATLKQTQWSPHDEGGIAGQINKITGEFRPSVGPNGKPMQANSIATGASNAYQRAKFTVANVMDDQGNPVGTSRLNQLQTGAPSMTEGQVMQLQGNKLGTQTYLGANQTVRQNLGVLDDMGQRGIIARATEDIDRNPGAFDSILSSAVQDGLSPQGAKLIAAMKQMNEFGSSFKAFTGNNGTATDSLRSIIHSNQPSTANSRAVNEALLAQDEALAQRVQQTQARPGAHAPHLPSSHQPAPLNPQAAAAPTTGSSWFSQYGGAPR